MSIKDLQDRELKKPQSIDINARNIYGAIINSIKSIEKSLLDIVDNLEKQNKNISVLEDRITALEKANEPTDIS